MFIVLVAGETSGDQLGAALIRAIHRKQPNARFVGIGGPLMKAEGCDCWWDTGQLSLMGLFEVVSHLPRLFTLRRQLVQRVLELKPDIFVGIDAPDFNLGVEKRLKARAIPVIHYVSPTVWAWRSGRIKTIEKSTDRVMFFFLSSRTFINAIPWPPTTPATPRPMRFHCNSIPAPPGGVRHRPGRHLYRAAARQPDGRSRKAFFFNARCR